VQLPSNPIRGPALGVELHGLVDPSWRTKRGRITKTGNIHLRTALVESAWPYQHRPANGAVIARRQARASDDTIAPAWKAQIHLSTKFSRLAATKSSRNVGHVHPTGWCASPGRKPGRQISGKARSQSHDWGQAQPLLRELSQYERCHRGRSLFMPFEDECLGGWCQTGFS